MMSRVSMLSGWANAAWGVVCGVAIAMAFFLPALWPFFSLAILFSILYILSDVTSRLNKIWNKLWELERRLDEKQNGKEPEVKDWLQEPPPPD
jgi:hypothetical protein